MVKACPHCGRIKPCPQHPDRDPNTTRNPRRNLAAHQRWARAIKKRDAHRCVKCGATQDLQAHHTHGIHNPAGITLCRTCHKEVDPHAR